MIQNYLIYTIKKKKFEKIIRNRCAIHPRLTQYFYTLRLIRYQQINIHYKVTGISSYIPWRIKSLITTVHISIHRSLPKISYIPPQNPRPPVVLNSWEKIKTIKKEQPFSIYTIIVSQPISQPIPPHAIIVHARLRNRHIFLSSHLVTFLSTCLSFSPQRSFRTLSPALQSPLKRAALEMGFIFRRRSQLARS